MKLMTPQEFTAKYLDSALAKLTLKPQYIVPLVAICIGYKVAAKENRGSGWGARIWFGRVADEKLFYNGIFFVRIMFPFFIGIGIRWAGSNPTKRELLQTYVGWKLNGFFSAVFRIQSDLSAKEGFTSPNPNLVEGFYDGPH